jgi:hypothetical protein
MTMRAASIAAKARCMASSKRSFSGPPTSTMRLAGAAPAALATAIATSAAAIGWKATGGIRPMRRRAPGRRLRR